MREILIRIGENPDRDGLLSTPGRFEHSVQYLTKGFGEDAKEVLLEAMVDVLTTRWWIIKDIEVFSLCEHHVLPFFGKAHVAYIPRGQVIGLSKVPRLVDVFARRLQVQERLTTQIADTILEAINPLGVGVVIEARNLCMMMRGVEKQHSSTITSSMLGAFRQKETREEFLALKSATETSVVWVGERGVEHSIRLLLTGSSRQSSFPINSQYKSPDLIPFLRRKRLIISPKSLQQMACLLRCADHAGNAICNGQT